MITIIGAGPVGNYLAYMLSKKNEKVRVVEEHKTIGKPVQCTGIVTSEFENIIKAKENFLVNKIKNARIHSTEKKFIEIKLKKENLVLDRTKLDQYLSDLAKEKGAEYITGKRFQGNTGKKLRIGGEFLETDYLIGADGPMSTVAKQNNLLCNRKFVVGNQIRARIKCERELVDFYLGIGCFGWMVPEDENTARIGVVSYDNSKKYMDKLLKQFDNYKIIEKQGGFIPVYNPKQILQKENIMLVGDAATQVKATTFGGLVPGLMGAEALAEDFENYPKNARKKLHKDLYIGLLLRKIMDRFTEKDYNELVKMFEKERIKKIIEETDRDFPTKFLLKLLAKEPRLLKFSRKLVF